MDSENLTKDYLGFKIEPTGYKMVAMFYYPPEESDGGLLFTTETRDDLKDRFLLGKILAIGKEAFQKEGMFPNGPHVKVGDWCHISRASREDKITADNIVYCYLNDTGTHGIIPDNEIVGALGLSSKNWTLKKIEERLLHKNRIKEND